MRLRGAASAEVFIREHRRCVTVLSDAARGLLRGNSELALHDWIVRWKIAAGHLRTLVTTVSRWELEIATYLHTGRPDGPAEAVNRKIFLASQNRLRLY